MVSGDSDTKQYPLSESDGHPGAKSRKTHQVEVTIEGHQCSHKHPTIQNRNPHAVVHILQHLAAP